MMYSAWLIFNNALNVVFTMYSMYIDTRQYVKEDQERMTEAYLSIVLLFWSGVNP